MLKTVKPTYVQKAPNGDWLLLEQGSPDKLLGTYKSRFDARVAQRTLKQYKHL